MAGNEEFVWKPISSGRNKGALTVVLPSSLTGNVQNLVVRTPTGQTTTIPFSNIANQGREHYRFDKPGNYFPEGSQVVATLKSGEPVTWDIGKPSSYYKAPGVGQQARLESAPTTSYNVPTGTSPGGTPYSQGMFYDFSTIPAPNVDFGSAWNFATGVGQQNKEAYLGNITDPRAREAALNLINTDIAGIKAGYEGLAPMVREAGNLDTQTNISRAGTIDKSNLARIPGFNTFNQQEAAKANEYNQAQQLAAVEKSGLDYTKRIGEVLSNLRTELKGRLPGEMDAALTAEMRNRGADMTSAAGVSALSGAGVRAQDRLNILERLGIMNRAEQLLPGILETAQNRLQAPVERPPTLYGQPTSVPLNPSTIENRLPVQSGLNAGAMQANIGTTATNYEIIPAVTALGSNLTTQQFNEQAEYNRDVMVGTQTQAQMDTSSNIQQGALNADRQAEIAREQAQSYREGLAFQQIGQGTLGGVVGGLGTLISESPIVGSVLGAGIDWLSQTPSTSQGSNASQGGAQSTGISVGAGTPTGRYGYTTPSGQFGNVMVDNLGNTSPSQQPQDTMYRIPEPLRNIGTNVSNIIGAGANAIRNVLGYEQSPSKTDNINFDNTPYSSDDGIGLIDNISSFVTGNNTLDSSDYISKTKTTGLDSKGFQSKVLKTNNENKILSDAAKPLTTPDNPQLDKQVMGELTPAMNNWAKMPQQDQVKVSGNTGISTLQSRNIITGEEAKQMRGVTNALSTIMNPNSDSTQKAIAVAQASAGLATTQYTGNINSPTTINGSPVVGQTETSFMVSQPNGNTVDIPKSSLTTASNIGSSLNAFSVLYSGADNESKLSALTGIGIEAGRANQIINDVQAGNSMAGLSIFNTAKNWGDMNIFEKSVSTVQTSQSVLGAVNNMNPSAISESNPLSYVSNSMGALGNVTMGAASAYGVYKGVQTAATVIEAVNDMPESKAVKAGATGLGMSGAAIGGGIGGMVSAATGLGIAGAAATGAAAGSAIPVPIVGTAIGAAIGVMAGLVAGSTGTGKNASQVARDGWRKGLKQMGIVDNNYNVQLANGATYDLGKDGNYKLNNVDGTTRRTSDVDWGNSLAVNSIPMAHLVNIGLGMNPNDQSKLSIFDNTTGQLVNAATSNAKSDKDVMGNYRAMLDKANIDPRHLAMNVEVLRNTNKINDQEYGVYLSTINKMYGTQLVPSSREQSTTALINQLKSKPKLTKYDKQLLNELQDTRTLAKNASKIEQRLAKLQEAQGLEVSRPMSEWNTNQQPMVLT